MIGIIANIVVDYVQLYIPEYLGDMVEIVSSKVHCDESCDRILCAISW